MQNNSVRSRSSVKTAPTECTSTTDEFALSPGSLTSAATEGLRPPRRSNTPTRSGHARSHTPSKRSSHSRRGSANRRERRPSTDSKGEEGAPTKPARRTSSGSSHHRRSSTPRLSGGALLEALACTVTPGTPSERSGHKTRSSVLSSPTGIIDDENPVSASSSGHGRRSSRHLCSPATDATPRSSRSERTSSRTKKQEHLGSEQAKRQQRSSSSNSNKWKSPLEAF